MEKSKLQSALYVVKQEITMLDMYVNSLKETARELFELADPNSDIGVEAFAQLNMVRNEIRKTKKQIEKLASVSKALKKGMK